MDKKAGSFMEREFFMDLEEEEIVSKVPEERVNLRERRREGGRNEARRPERNHERGGQQNNRGGGRSYGIFDGSIARQSLINDKSIFGAETQEEKPARKPAPQPAAAPKPMREAAPAPQASPRNFFVFDIETIPCVETGRKLLNLPESTLEDEVIEAMKKYHLEATAGQNDFLRQPFHRVACVSFMFGNIIPTGGGRESYKVRGIKTYGRNGESEEEMLRTLFTNLGKNPSRLVTFNGRTFDLPVLQYRAMKYGIEAGWLYSGGVYNYNHRFAPEKHCDLIDMFSNFGASARVKMAELAALFGIPCKVDGVDGASVLPMFRDGRIAEIADYCERDVLCTYLLYLRFMHHSGKLSAKSYNMCMDELYMRLEGEDAPLHFREFGKQYAAMNSSIYLGSVGVKAAESEAEPMAESEASSNDDAGEPEPASESETETEGQAVALGDAASEPFAEGAEHPEKDERNQ